MDRDEFIQTVTIMKDDLIQKLLVVLPFLRNYRCEIGSLDRHLMALIRCLELVLLRAYRLPAAAQRCVLPAWLCVQYETAMAETRRHLADATLRLLVELEFMEEVRVGQAEVDDGATASCSICLEMYHAEEVIAALRCGHRFHRCCILTWFSRDLTCPYCRRHPGDD